MVTCLAPPVATVTVLNRPSSVCCGVTPAPPAEAVRSDSCITYCRWPTMSCLSSNFCDTWAGALPANVMVCSTLSAPSAPRSA